MVSKKIISKWLKLVFIVSSVSFVLIQIQMRHSNNNSNIGGGERFDHERRLSVDRRASNGVSPVEYHQPVADRSSRRDNSDDDTARTLSKTAGGGVGVGMPGLDEIRRSIEDNNAHAQVNNEHAFEPIENVDYVLVVQVHNRSKYLEHLINSLSKAKGIEKALVIFSHDYYSAVFNELIQSIEFCRTMQIFFPYSVQIFPDRFPGQDPKDCPGDIGKAEAEVRQCQNWRTPDKYGHYRVAKLSQVKHHWWWKMNYIFDGISRLRNYTGWVLRLEEDHYVSPDFLYTFDYIVKNKENLCAECSVITLGFYLKSYNSYSSTMNKLAVHPWFSSRHNMGMAINRQTWERIRSCAQLFCSFDDYNWDWSLMRVNLKCLKQPMTVIFAKSPRVFHIGDCGIHHTGKQCTADASATKVIDILRSVQDQLFPDKLEVLERSRRTLKAPKENGGWGDLRDHQLCLNNTLVNVLAL